MSESYRCPYCSGKAGKIKGRVGQIQTHFTFGWGERLWKCSSCGETWSVCYALPPKSHNYLVVGAKEIIEVGVVDGIRGFASPLVLKAKIKKPKMDSVTETTGRLRVETADQSGEEVAA